MNCILDKFLKLLKYLFFQKNVHSRAFVVHICDNVIPALPELVTSDDSANIRLDILKVLAEISEFSGDLEEQETKVEKVFSRLLVSIDTLECKAFGHSIF